MTIKIIGAILVIASCGGFGFYLADAYRREEKTLRQLMRSLEVMICELEYRLPDLVDLCKLGAKQCGGMVGQVLMKLSCELEQQDYADASLCMGAILKDLQQLPPRTRNNLHLLGQTLGRFDLQGQVMGIQSVMALCKRDLDSLAANREERLRGYRTLGVCAGIALVILFL